MNSKVVAVIDLGSNSIRMTVAEIQADGMVKELGNYRETVRIASGLKGTGKIDSLAFTRTVHALQTFCECMHSFCVSEVIAVATEALRRAENKEEFISYVKEKTGICFQIISGEAEARYDFLGVSEGREIQDCILMDIGGGSTEFMQIANGKLEHIVSLPLGAVVLTEGFLKTDPPAKIELDAMEHYIYMQLQMHACWLFSCKKVPVFAIGGTNRAMMKLLHKKEFTREEVQRLYDTFKMATVEKRKQWLEAYADRADIVIGGLASLVVLANALEVEKIMVSEKGLRDGILYEMAKIS